MATTVKNFMENQGRYRKNSYAGKNKDANRTKTDESPQKPKRMYVTKIPEADEIIPKDVEGLLAWLLKRRVDPDTPSDDELAIWMTSPKTIQNVVSATRRKYMNVVTEEIEDDPRKQLALTKRHRYGDDIDILRATFTKTIEQVNEETFQLMQKTKVLHHAVMKMNETIPKITKYRYGTLLENGVHSLLADCCRIQRKYYRRNMLESMHIELDILQHYFFECHIDYPEWMTTQQLYVMNNLANEVSSIIGGLLKTTVA